MREGRLVAEFLHARRLRGGDRRRRDRTDRTRRQRERQPRQRRPQAARRRPGEARAGSSTSSSASASSGSSRCSSLLVARDGERSSRASSSCTNIQFILVDTTTFALLALGETMVVLTRNVDLSIGSVARPVGLHVRRPVRAPPRDPDRPGLPRSASGSALACGFVNGFLTVVGRVPSLVVTLAMLYIIRGIDVLIVGGGQVVASSLPNVVHRDPRSRRSSAFR